MSPVVQTAIIIIVFLANACLVGVGIYLSAYLKKKAEALATKEEFKTLKEQTAELTLTTTKIEADISSDVWDRQKRWELKREILFEATRRMAAVEDGLLELDSIVQVEHKESKQGDEAWAHAKADKIIKWSDTSAAFDETRLFVGVVCAKDTRKAFDDFGSLANIVAAKLSPGNDGEILKKSRTELTRNRMTVEIALRKELGLKDIA